MHAQTLQVSTSHAGCLYTETDPAGVYPPAPANERLHFALTIFFVFSF